MTNRRTSLWAGTLCLLLCLGLWLTTVDRAKAQAVYQVGTGASASAYNPTALVSEAVVGSRNAAVFDGVSSGSLQGETVRWRHHINRACGDLRLLYANKAAVGASNPITVTASVEVGGILYPLTFGGASAVTLPVGGSACTDPLPLEFAKAQVIYERVYVHVAASGQKWPVRNNLATGAGEGTGGADTDNTQTSGTAWVTGDNSQEKAYGATALLGTSATGAGTPGTVCVIGDSIGGGGTDMGYTTDATLDANGGWAERGLRDSCGLLNVSIGGETSAAWSDATKAFRKTVAAGATHFVVQYGVNDWAASQSAATLEAARQAIINSLLARGVPASHIFQTPLTPQTTSSDSWATVGNQSPLANRGPGSERSTFNAWVRSNPGGVRCLDIAAAVESGTDTGLFKAGYTADGTHPSAAGHAAMGAVLATAYTAGWFNN